MIRNEAAFLELLEADSCDQAKRHVYKYTNCGAWLEFSHDGVRIGSIVEGCDFGTAVYKLEYPFTRLDWEMRVLVVESEADQLWLWANDSRYQSEGTDPPEFDYEFETDGHSS